METTIWIDSCEGQIIDSIPFDSRSQARREAAGSVARLGLSPAKSQRYARLTKPFYWGLFEEGVCTRVYESREMARSRKSEGQKIVKLYA